MKTLCVYCGSNAGGDPAYAALARDFGARLARDGIALVRSNAFISVMTSLALSAALAKVLAFAALTSASAAASAILR